ncbi:hypothetical protein LMH73_004495 [Vibrio splendidus]|nr:hypothetical protein [Vibrio splendidus]MCC4883262.1 hypothetical protein [Vibrio splendidus]
MKIGVCWFDDTNIGSSGWRSVAGETAKRIVGINELESDVLWVTNLDYRQYKKLNLTRTPNIVDEQFFRSKISVLAQEVGIDDDADVLCRKLSGILHGVHALGCQSFGMSEASLASYRYTNALQAALLTSGMRKQPIGGSSGKIAEAIRQSTQENQGMSGKFVPRGSKAVQFIFPRATYAKWLLSQDYPVNNNWSPLKMKDSANTVIGYEDGTKIKGTDSVIGKLKELSETKVGVLQVSVLSVDESYANHSKFGAGANNMIRRWATIPEIIEISKYSKISIMSGFCADGGKLELPNILIPDESEYSLSKGILLENAWVALSSPVYVPGYNNVSPLGAYMRAYDRIMCGRAAASFSNHGFIVGSYGTGRVIVYVRHGEEDMVRELAFKNNLLPMMRYMGE